METPSSCGRILYVSMIFIVVKNVLPIFPKPSLYSWRCLRSPPNFENNPKMNECKMLTKLLVYNSNSFGIAHEKLKTSFFSFFALVGWVYLLLNKTKNQMLMIDVIKLHASHVNENKLYTYLPYSCAYFQPNITIGEEFLHFQCSMYPPLWNNNETFLAQDNVMSFGMILQQIITTISLPSIQRRI